MRMVNSWDVLSITPKPAEKKVLFQVQCCMVYLEKRLICRIALVNDVHMMDLLYTLDAFLLCCFSFKFFELHIMLAW